MYPLGCVHSVITFYLRALDEKSGQRPTFPGIDIIGTTHGSCQHVFDH